MKTLTNESGRSMIEMLGVLAIIGVLSVGGIAGYSKAMMKYRTNKTLDQISMIITNIRTLYANQQTYTGLTTGLAYKMGLTPDEMGVGSTLTNAFQGNVTIAPGSSGAAGTGSTGAFMLKFEGLPREACVTVATQDWGSNYTTGFLGIGVNTDPSACVIDNGTNTTDAEGVHCATSSAKGPMSVALAAAKCAAGNSNVIWLKYY